MLARRLSGLITGLLMLHLTFVGADLACAEHGDRAPQGHAPATAHHERHVVAAHVEASVTPDQPCETPTQTECCRAMTSCAVNAAFERGAPLESVPPVRSAIEPAALRAPLSQITSPDPPPPKA
jgi:hypothetical protein